MISLHPLGPGDLDRIAGLTVNDDQRAFTGNGAEIAADPTEGIAFHEIRLTDANGARAVGVFKIDPTYHQRHDFAQGGEYGLRGFLIDAAHQGRGIGKAALALMRPYLATSHPNARAVFLTVNHRNPAARRIYLSGGFLDTGRDYLRGGSGPQHILRLAL